MGTFSSTFWPTRQLRMAIPDDPPGPSRQASSRAASSRAGGSKRNKVAKRDQRPDSMAGGKGEAFLEPTPTGMEPIAESVQGLPPEPTPLPMPLSTETSNKAAALSDEAAEVA